MSATGKKYVQFGAAIAIIVLALGYLGYTGVQQSKSYYVTISELRGLRDGAYSKRLRVAGNVAPGTIKRHGPHLEFTLIEEEVPGGPPVTKQPVGKPWQVSVEHTCMEAPPDTFKDDSQALAEGYYAPDGVFHAKAIQAKCASKYAPAEQGAGAQQGTSVAPAAPADPSGPAK